MLTLTTQLLKAVKRRPGHTEEQIDKEAVLLRAYGKGTEVLIDRESGFNSPPYRLDHVTDIQHTLTCD